MTDLSIIRPRKDILLAGSGNPTVATTARVGDRYQNTDAPYEMFTCVSKQDFGWGDVHGWVGTQGTIIDPDILDPSNANLVAGYTMDSVTGATLNDMSVNGNNGTITGAVQAPGKIGNALEFDGVDDVVKRNAVFSGFPLSLSTWVKSDNIAQGFCLLGTNGEFNKYQGVELSYDGSQGKMLCHYGTGVDQSGSSRKTFALLNTGQIVQGVYHHVAANFIDFNTAELFIDGVEYNFPFESGTGTFADFVGGQLSFGNLVRGSAYQLDGQLDHYRLFDRPLIQAEVTALTNEGSVT